MGNNKSSLRLRVLLRITITVVIIIILMSVFACIVAYTNFNKQREQTIGASLSSCSNQLSDWLNAKASTTLFMAEEFAQREYDIDKDTGAKFLEGCIPRDADFYDCYVGFEDGVSLF